MAPSLFVGAGSAADYPVYAVTFSTTGVGAPVGFIVANVNIDSPGEPGGLGNTAGALTNSGTSDDQDLLDAIKSYLETNGWKGGTVSDVTITEYQETTSSVS